MSDTVSRRDFLGTAALTVAAGTLPPPAEAAVAGAPWVKRSRAARERFTQGAPARLADAGEGSAPPATASAAVPRKSRREKASDTVRSGWGNGFRETRESGAAAVSCQLAAPPGLPYLRGLPHRPHRT